MADLSLQNHPRVDQAVEQVGEQLPDQGQHAKHQRQTHHRRIVAFTDALEEEPPHTGPGKDLLDDHGAADQPGQGEPQQRDQRNERVAKGMAEHAARAGPLGPRGADVVLANRLLHVCLDEAAVVGEADVGLTGDRQNRMAGDVDRPRGKAGVGRQITHAEERELEAGAPQPDGKYDLQEERCYERRE